MQHEHETVLISGTFKMAIARLSRTVKVPTRVLNNETGLTNTMAVTLGTAVKRQEILKQFKIPGSVLVQWLMDTPVTVYWYSKALRLAKYLGVPEAKAFDRSGA